MNFSHLDFAPCCTVPNCMLHKATMITGDGALCATRRLPFTAGYPSPCSGPKPESYPRTYPNPRISEGNPGPDPLDPEAPSARTPGTPAASGRYRAFRAHNPNLERLVALLRCEPSVSADTSVWRSSRGWAREQSAIKLPAADISRSGHGECLEVTFGNQRGASAAAG